MSFPCIRCKRHFGSPHAWLAHVKAVEARWLRLVQTSALKEHQARVVNCGNQSLRPLPQPESRRSP